MVKSTSKEHDFFHAFSSDLTERFTCICFRVYKSRIVAPILSNGIGQHTLTTAAQLNRIHRKQSAQLKSQNVCSGSSGLLMCFGKCQMMTADKNAMKKTALHNCCCCFFVACCLRSTLDRIAVSVCGNGTVMNETLLRM